jgi:hypothetical protein
MIEQRKHFYTDRKLQGYLLVGLITLEFVLVCLLVFYLYSEINNIIEDHLYRAHRIYKTTWPEIFTLLSMTMSGFVVINILVLYLAHVIWGRYVKQTITLFSSVLDRMIDLDFSGSWPSKQGQHRIVDLMEQWFDKEKKRNEDISTHIERLSRYEGQEIGQDDIENLKQILHAYRCLLTDNLKHSQG